MACRGRRRPTATGRGPTGVVVKDVLWFALVMVLLVFGAGAWYAIRGGRHLSTPEQHAAYQALRTANRCSPALRTGLHEESAARAAPHLRTLIGADALVLADLGGVLARENLDAHHAALLDEPIRAAISTGRPQTLTHEQLVCDAGAACRIQAGVVVPVHVDEVSVGALAALAPEASAGLVRLTAEVGQFVSRQLELAELDRSRRRADQAELSFLRAQISPHFIYNALTAIESFVRTDPDRARELLVGFAEFTRYTFRSRDQFVTMAEELRLVDTYLDLEQARFGDRLRVTLRVAPEVLGVTIPSLILQPIVENAVRHGLWPLERVGHLRISVDDVDSEARICIEDDGVGARPDHVRRVLSGTDGGEGVGLHNVDERLRAVFGDSHGLTIETAVGSGTKVTIYVPKFHAGVQAS
jgi:two-component system LytT family sensor kinase